MTASIERDSMRTYFCKKRWDLEKNTLFIEEAVTEFGNIRDMLRWAVTQFNSNNLFYGHGTDNAWDDAVALILHTLHLPPDVSPQVLDALLTLNERRKIARLIMRRVKESMPVPYLTHEAWFAGLSFFVDERVLIPRSPIAELIEQQFSPWIAEENVSRILDLCTGSGCIAIASALAFPDAIIDAVDISAEALEVAEMNKQRHGATNVNLIKSDLFSELKESKYDIIVSNPPYVSEAEMTALPAEFKHEPNLGLAAGKDGLDVVLKILRHAKKYLTPHGILIVEVGNSEEALIEKYPKIPFVWLEFQRGGGGVFMLTRETLNQVVI